APGQSPWRRCGALLRIDARDQGRALARELILLWQAMAAALGQVALGTGEERRAHEVLGAQLEAALRGAAAEVRAALLDDAPGESLHFGGPIAVCYRPADEDEPALLASGRAA